MRRRHLLTSAAVTGVLAVSGCLSILDRDETHDHTFQTTTGELEHPENHETVGDDAFSVFVNSVRENRAYGSTGIWGQAEDRPDDTIPLVGAITSMRQHVNDVTAHHTLALFRLDEDGDSDRAHHQLWCWSGYDVTEADDDLTRISIELSAEHPHVSLGIYSPWSNREAGEEYRVGHAGQSAMFPLPEGEIGPDHDAIRIGPGGNVRIDWMGHESERLGIAMCCEAYWRPAGDYDIDLTVSGTFA